MVSFKAKRFLNFDYVQFICLLLLVFLMSYVRKLAKPTSQRFMLMFSPESSTVLALTFSVLESTLHYMTF